MAKPLVALVGRPNVGKSTLYNRIIGDRVAIVEDVAGTTRDRLYAEAEWSGRNFVVIDTGGLEMTPGSDIGRRVREQAEAALALADVVVLVVDAREGETAGDSDIANLLRSSEKPIIVAANKADNEGRRLNSVEFFGLGLENVWPISALHGLGTGDLLDEIVDRLPPAVPEEIPTGTRVAIVGRPNVGKSSLVNALLGEERVVVSEIPGTTRDTVDVEVRAGNGTVIFVDTAGIRRRGRVEPGVEKYSVLRAVRAIERADVVLVVLDATEGVTAQDAHLAGFVRDSGKGLALLFNKSDLVSQSNETLSELADQVRSDLNFVAFASLLFVSAKTGQNIDQIFPAIEQIQSERGRRVPTAGLNAIVQEAIHAHSPAANRGRSVKIFYATQVRADPPTFVFFVNDPKLIHFTYQRFLENRLRAAYGFAGTPIRLFFRARTSIPREEEP